MKKLNTYTFVHNKAVATIENRGSYWLLTFSHPEKIIIVPKDCQIWNTLRGAKEYAFEILSNY